MGQAKNVAIEIEERGFDDIDKYICSECVEDDYLKQWIDENATETIECDYCGNIHPVVLMTDFMYILMDTFCKYYENAEGNLYWDNEEYEYWGSSYDSEYVVNDFAAQISSNQQVIDDIINAIHDISWCKMDPYGMTEREICEYSWQSFSDLVKYKNRYFFMQEKNDQYGEKYTPLDILDIIAKQIKELKLVKNMPKNSVFYRVRILSDKTPVVLDGTNLGAPPNEFAKSDRMSARGISCFYASDNIETSKEEVLSDDSNGSIVVGEFQNVYPLKYLDLAAINNIQLPSVFDSTNYSEREAILFLKALNEELTRPISELQEIEYVPTQIFAEYFKLVQKLDGIKYNSSKNKNGTCYVLFFNNEQCIEDKKNILGEDVCQLKLVKAYNL